MTRPWQAPAVWRPSGATLSAVSTLVVLLSGCARVNATHGPAQRLQGPVARYAAYIGGAGPAWAASVALDDRGHIYVGGSRDTNLPTGGAALPRLAGTRGFVMGLSGSDERPRFVRQLTGTVTAVAVGPAGNVYAVGYTRSDHFPVVHALQTRRRGGDDAFIVKMTASGDLLYSTYLGGARDDVAEGVAVGERGNVIVAGSTRSADFPTRRAFQPRNHGGQDGFVVKMSADGKLLYSTYLGGSRDDAATAVAVDHKGNAFIAGGTRSVDFPVHDSLQMENAGGEDAFITRLDPSGQLSYSTYLGGGQTNCSCPPDDGATGIAVDRQGNVYITGYTVSTDFPNMEAAQSHNATGDEGGYDAFITKLSPSGGQFIYSTYFGGGEDFASAIAVDRHGDAYVTGVTHAWNLPVRGAIQLASKRSSCLLETPTYGVIDSPCPDAYAVELDASGQLVYSTYLGGHGYDKGTGIAVDNHGDTYVIGYTTSRDFPGRRAAKRRRRATVRGFLIELGHPNTREKVTAPQLWRGPGPPIHGAAPW